tara:strand:+ start:518 stop:1096 length:579 start_codon:yes stop_codon:yes gene_type:complete
MNEKSIDDIINQSNIVNAITSMSADATNVDTRNQMIPNEQFDQGYQIRNPSYEERSGVSNEEILAMIMGISGGGGGKSLADAVKSMFKGRASAKIPKVLETEVSRKEIPSNIWRSLSKEQKEDVAETFGKTKEFNFEEFQRAQKALKGARALSEKEVAPVGRVVDYMGKREMLPLQSLPQRVALEISKLLEK